MCVYIYIYIYHNSFNNKLVFFIIGKTIGVLGDLGLKYRVTRDLNLEYKNKILQHNMQSK